MNNIKLLDCTLRDGGLGLDDIQQYGYSCSFTANQISTIYNNLLESNADLIECGSIEISDNDKTKFAIYKNIENISKGAIPLSKRRVALYRGPDTPIEDIPRWTKSLIKNIRVIIRYSELEKSMLFCRDLAAKGYNVFIQPMATARYTDKEIKYMISMANEMKAFAIYFVDSYGYLTYNEIKKYFNLYNKYLKNTIYIGFHAHNNINMAFANAQFFIGLARKENRKAIIDSSCFGMGQGAGNLQTELISNYLNKEVGTKYKIDKILTVCDLLEPLYKLQIWGYSPMYLIPAQNRAAYKFSVALRKRYNYSYPDISECLKDIPDVLRHRYSKENLNALFKLRSE